MDQGPTALHQGLLVVIDNIDTFDPGFHAADQRPLSPERLAEFCQRVGPVLADIRARERLELIRSAWSIRARELAWWTWKRLVIRVDVWGGYRLPHERGKEYIRPDGTTGKLGTSTTRPTKSRRGIARLR